MSDAPVKVGMIPPHPGAFIRDEVLEVMGLSVGEAAAALGVRRATLSNLLNGHAALSPEMALRLEKAFAVNMEMLLRLQAWHDTVTMRSHASNIEVKRVAYAQKAEPLRWAARKARVAAKSMTKRTGLDQGRPRSRAKATSPMLRAAKAKRRK